MSLIVDWLQGLGLWPAQISSHAAEVDGILIGFSLVLLLFTLPVFVLMAWFAIKYRKGSPARREGRPKGSPWIESAWSVIPLVIMGIVFVQAARAYFTLERDVPDALQVDVVAKQWMWKFQHPSGRRQINQLNVPVDSPVELTMISQDVIHSLFLPALRIKQDVLPHRYTKLRFQAEETGRFHLTCTEFCGTDHSRMGGDIVVMTKQDYEAWVAEASEYEGPAAMGRQLYEAMDCGGCHEDDGATGPDLAGVYGQRVALASGETVVADERYLRAALVLPNEQVVAGYRPIMPTYGDQLSEQEIRNVITYLKTLSPRSDPAP